jgi:hypothetical protein
MSVSMKENQMFEAIRNHRVEAPTSIMEKAIHASKRRRFLTFHWSSLNVWYLAILLAGSIGWGLMNDTKTPSLESSTAKSVERNNVQPVTSEQPAIQKVEKKSLRQREAAVSPMQKSPEQSTVASEQPILKKPGYTETAQKEKLETPNELALTPNAVSTTEEKSVDNNLRENREVEQEIQVEVKAKKVDSPNSKRKIIPVKVVKP